MPFLDKELQKLSQQIINNAVKKRLPVAGSNLLVERLRQSILKRQAKLPPVVSGGEPKVF